MLAVKISNTSMDKHEPIIFTIINEAILITISVIFIENKTFFRSSLADKLSAICDVICDSTSS